LPASTVASPVSPGPSFTTACWPGKAATRALDRRLGLAPSPEAEALHRDLLAGRVPGLPEAFAAAL
jgi:hypothetical protein